MSTIEVVRPTMLGGISLRNYVKNLDRNPNAVSNPTQPPSLFPRFLGLDPPIRVNHVMLLTYQFAEIEDGWGYISYEGFVYEYRNSFGWCWYMPRVEIVSDEVYESDPDQEDDSQ